LIYLPLYSKICVDFCIKTAFGSGQAFCKNFTCVIWNPLFHSKDSPTVGFRDISFLWTVFLVIYLVTLPYDFKYGFGKEGWSIFSCICCHEVSWSYARGVVSLHHFEACINEMSKKDWSRGSIFLKPNSLLMKNVLFLKPSHLSIKKVQNCLTIEELSKEPVQMQAFDLNSVLS